MLCRGSHGHVAPKRAARRTPWERHRSHPEAASVLRQRPDAALDLEVLALEVDVLARPEFVDDRDRLLEQRDLVGARPAEQLELRLVVADADTQDHPPARDHVHHGGVLGNLHRVVERQQHDRRAEVDPIGDGREGAQPDERGRRVAVVHHVVLGEEEPIEAHLLWRACRRRGSPASRESDSSRRAGPGGGTQNRTSSLVSSDRGWSDSPTPPITCQTVVRTGRALPRFRSSPCPGRGEVAVLDWKLDDRGHPPRDRCDESFRHQAVAPAAETAYVDAAWAERRRHSRQPRRRLGAGAGRATWPHGGRRTAAAGLNTGTIQFARRAEASFALGDDPDRPDVGPVRIEPVVPLREVRLVLDEPGLDFGFDLTFEARFAPAPNGAQSNRTPRRVPPPTT